MKKTKVDILMTIHNGEKYLIQTIDSLKSQKFKNWKLIIINNYSTDNTPKILNKIKKETKKIEIFNTKKLLSRPAALNFGLKHCKSDYIGILDADDLVSSNWLKDVDEIIKLNNNFGIIVGNYIPINERNKKLKKKKLFNFNQGIINYTLNYTFPCAHSGCILNRKIVHKFKYPYDEDLLTGHDWRLFLKISHFNKVLFINKDWVFWRRYSESVSAKNRFISKKDILKNLLYAKKQKLSFTNLTKNSFMITIQIYHLFLLFISEKKYKYLLYTSIVMLLLPLVYFNNKFVIKSYIKIINE